MVSASETDRDFYAVRPELVLRAARLFAIASSMLEKGAKRLHSRAVAIEAGKEAGQWGRHQRPVIAQYCEYTQTSGSEFLLPWQELVEHRPRYDGKEGISSRTGNKPLSTVVRVLTDANALQRARTVSGISVEALAERSGIPPALMYAIESGDWPDVAESTAAGIARGLDLPVEELFTAINDKVLNDTDGAAEQPDIDVAPAPGRQAARLLATAVAVLAIAGITSYAIWQSETDTATAIPANETLVGTLWRVSIVLENRNIPIPEETAELFSNGGYLALEENGVAAFNWIDPNQLAPLPGEFSWQLDNGVITIVLNGPTYEFDAGEPGETLKALDTTRSFEMTMHRIRLGGEAE